MIEELQTQQKHFEEHKFSGNIYIFHAFDVGDDVNFGKIQESGDIIPQQSQPSKHFKTYHIPLSIDLSELHVGTNCLSAKIHNFGALLLTYKIPFNDTFEALRKKIETIDNEYQEQSLTDARLIYDKITRFITKPKFFYTRSWYPVIQIHPEPDTISVSTLQQQYGGIIASTLRFEQETLSEYQKNEILDAAIGYFKGDLIIIDTGAAFVYDKDYKETLDFFEFTNIQNLELKYFDHLLNTQLNAFYEGRAIRLPFTSYLPFIGTNLKSPIGELGRLRVDISVIVERLEDSIRLIGEAFFSELYELLAEKRELKILRESINKKLSIIQDIRSVYQNRIDAIREDILSVLIIILIFIELLFGLLR